MDEKPLYGVWIPGVGWLKGEDQKALAFTLRDVALEVSQRVGSGAKIYFIDPSLRDLENYLLEAERKKRKEFISWHIFRTLYVPKKNS